MNKEGSRDEFRFLKWPIYGDAKLLVKSVFEVTEALPARHKFDLGTQLNRSALSILLNIAEGSGKNSDVDFNHFLNIAMGSLNETMAGLDLAHDHRLLSTKEFEKLKTDLLNIGRQLGGFKKKLINK